jgi:phytanoyl-CoA hydroxylase
MTNPKTYYEEQGYYIFRQLVPHNLIDKLLAEYQQKILPSKGYFFRQSSNRWEQNKISSFGYSEESFLDVHDYPRYPTFAEAVLNIYSLKEVREALTSLTEQSEHNLMQSMFFDLNAATPAHQDWYYLDSIPAGHLLAGWFALEDIHPEAGRFFVMPKTHLIDFDLSEDEKISHASYVTRVKKYIETHQDNIYAPALEKGDVLFWNSRTVHGSGETLNPCYSRKSLTAHYLPSEFEFGKRYVTSPSVVDYSTYEGMKYRLAPDEHKYYSLTAKLKTDLFDYLWQRPKLNRIITSMKRPLKALVGQPR